MVPAMFEALTPGGVDSSRISRDSRKIGQAPRRIAADQQETDEGIEHGPAGQ